MTMDRILSRCRLPSSALAMPTAPLGLGARSPTAGELSSLQAEALRHVADCAYPVVRNG